MLVVPRAVGYLLVGAGLLILARWAVPYVVSPALFRPGVPQAVLAAAVLAGAIELRRRAR